MSNWYPDLETLEDLRRHERPFPVRLMDAALFVLIPIGVLVAVAMVLAILKVWQ